MSTCPKCGLPMLSHVTDYVGVKCECDIFGIPQPRQKFGHYPPLPPKPELTQKQIVLAQMVIGLLPVIEESYDSNICYSKAESDLYVKDAVNLAKRILEACKDE